MSQETLGVYRDVWATHLRNEVLVERMRRENSGQVNMHQAFEAIDQGVDGYIDDSDVSLFFYNNFYF
jgi:hypothetical protein